MIPTPKLTNPIGTIVKHDDLIFTASDPKKTRVPVDEYSIIVCENDPKVYVSTLSNCMEIDEVKFPYYLQHTDLFENAQKIFKDCFGVDSDVLIASVYKKDFTKSSFLFSNRQLIENALNKVDNVCVFNLNNSNEPGKISKKIKDELKLRKLKYLKLADDELSITLPYRVFPVVGTYNDLRFGTNPNFSLIFGSFLSEEIYKLNKEEEKNKGKANNIDNLFETIIKEDNEESNPSLWISHFDEKIKQIFGLGIPLYCIKKFDLHNPDYILNKKKKNEEIQGFENYTPWDMNPFYESINRQAVTRFNDVIIRLLLGYNRASYLGIDIDAFVATMADFFELDRTPSTVENSLSLQNQLIRKFEKASFFAANVRGLSMKHFIEFFIVESIIDFKEFFEDPAKELRKAMAEKVETRKLIGSGEILSRFLTNETANDNYARHLKGQIIAKNDIAKWL